MYKVWVVGLGVFLVTLGCDPIGDGALRNNGDNSEEINPHRIGSSLDGLLSEENESESGDEAVLQSLERTVEDYKKLYSSFLNQVKALSIMTNILSGNGSGDEIFDRGVLYTNVRNCTMLLEAQCLGDLNERAVSEAVNWLFEEVEQDLWMDQLSLLEALLEYGGNLSVEYSRNELERRYLELSSKIKKGRSKEWAAFAYVVQGKLHLHRKESRKAKRAYQKAALTLQQYERGRDSDQLGVALVRGQIYYGLARCKDQEGIGEAKQSRCRGFLSALCAQGDRNFMHKKKVLDLLNQAKKQYEEVQNKILESESRGRFFVWLRDYAKVLDMEIACRKNMGG